MKFDVYNLSNEKVSELEVRDEIFGAEVKPHLFHEVVKMQLANRRRGTHAGKTRSAVSGGGRKPFRQKGTGNARQGTRRAPHFVGGGWVFAKQPRDYSYRLNKRKLRGALISAVSMLAQEGRIKVVEKLELSEAKTKLAKSLMSTLGVERALVVDGLDVGQKYQTGNNEPVRLGVRNLQSYKYLRPEGVNVYDILHFGGMVVSVDGLKRLEERLV